jgi:small GTP-binding protein
MPMMKMCVIGDAAVGKTSLIQRYVYNKFDDKYISTIGTKISAKDLRIKTGEKTTNLKLQIWDVLGQSDFSKVHKRAYMGSKGALLVMDLTRKETLNSFDNWIMFLQKTAGEIPVVVLANKCDLEPEFGKDEIEMVVSYYNCPYYITSAKTGVGVNEAFYQLGELILTPGSGITQPQQDMSKAFEREMKIEAELDRKLTAVEAEDLIMARYCDLLGDQDYAMAVIRKQYKKAGVDFRDPSIEGLEKVVNYLIEAASGKFDVSILKKEKNTYMGFIKRIK